MYSFLNNLTFFFAHTVYITSYDEGAESNCEVAVMQALQWDPQGLDGLLALASLRLSQNRSKDAGDVMTSIFDKVMHLRNVTNSRTIVEELSSSSLPDEVTGL